MLAQLRLADVLAELMRRPDYPYTPGLLHRRSGVPKATIVNWLEGRVERPRAWQDLARVAAALRLSAAEADRLLQSASHPPLAALRAEARAPKDQALLEAWAAPAPTRVARLVGLPTPATPLVGRAHEVAAVCALLRRPDARLVTLLGPGGAGKTRLALQAAAELAGEYADGVVFVALAQVREPQLALATIAQALGIGDSGGPALLDRLAAALGGKQMLLLLDNCEQVLAAAPLIAQLLAATPRLKLLATSRAVLRLSGEHEYAVPPLHLPGPEQPAAMAAPAALAEYSALQLFVERAQAVRPGFAPDAQGLRAVAAICARLDGLPLAIELAAARCKLLTPQALLARLDRSAGRSSLELLTGGARDLPAHQQTLRGTIDWSYSLLSPAEQALFAQLAVFAGGCTIEAAEAVCAELSIVNEELSGGSANYAPPHSQFSMLNSIAALVDQSLLRQEAGPDGEPRFAMLETIREYALERLAAHPAQAGVRARHAQHYLALAEAAEQQLGRADESIWLDRLEREHANLRAALEWCLPAAADEALVYRGDDLSQDGRQSAGASRQAATVQATADSGNAVLGARLAGALGEFWWTRGYIGEGRRWLARALGLAAGLPAAVRAKAQARAGMLAWTQGDYEQAHALCAQAAAHYRAADDLHGLAWALRHQSYVAWEHGDAAQTAALLGESLALCRQAGDERGSARALHLLAWVAVAHGDEPLAAARYQECLALCRRLGDKQFAAHALNDLGLSLRRQGDLQQAKALIEGGLALRRELGVQAGIAWSLLNLGLVARDQGEYVRAAEWFRECLQLRRNLGDRRGMAECLEALAATAGRAGLPNQATQLYGAAAALRELIGVPLPQLDRADYEAQIGVVRAQLPADSFAAAWGAGQALSAEQLPELVEGLAL